MNAESWVNVLFTYGPFAILVLLVFVTEAKLRRAGREAAPEQKRTFLAVYVLNWAAVFGLVIYSTYAWSRTNLAEEQTIRGRVERLTGFETLATSSANLYFRKIYVGGPRYDYEWRLVAPKRLAVGQKINITVDPSTCSGGEGEITDYDLTIRPAFYEGDVLIYYDSARKKMFVRADGSDEELPRSNAPLVASAETPATPDAAGPSLPWALFGTVAHAQSPAQKQQQQSARPDDFARALESPDAIVRRNARADLARRGQEAVPWIDAVLSDPYSSYRLRLGAIAALNSMQGPRVDALRPAAVEAIRKASADADEALRNEARGFLARYQSALSAAVIYEHYNYSGKMQGFQPGTYSAVRRQLGDLPNDSASSLRVARDHAVRLCDNEAGGKGGGLCESYGAGEHQLKGGVADRVSFVQVSKKP